VELSLFAMVDEVSSLLHSSSWGRNHDNIKKEGRTILYDSSNLRKRQSMMPQQSLRTLRGALMALLLLVGNSDAFAPTVSFGRRRSSCRPHPLPSSVGGNGGGGPPPEEGGNGDWDEIFGEESENLRKAREYMSENALPINHDLQDDEDESGDSSSMVRKPQFFADGSSPSEEAMASNPYLAVVSKLSPSEMISRFTSTAHPRVQNAVRSTVLSLIGGLPKRAFDTTTITTGQR
jgi:hypothetical protein